jgi:hypothetical protein
VIIPPTVASGHRIRWLREHAGPSEQRTVSWVTLIGLRLMIGVVATV